MQGTLLSKRPEDLPPDASEQRLSQSISSSVEHRRSGAGRRVLRRPAQGDGCAGRRLRHHVGDAGDARSGEQDASVGDHRCTGGFGDGYTHRERHGARND